MDDFSELSIQNVRVLLKKKKYLAHKHKRNRVLNVQDFD